MKGFIMPNDIDIKSFDFDNWDNINHLPAERFRVTIILSATEILRLSMDSQSSFSKYDERSVDQNDATQQDYYFSGILIGYRKIKNDSNVIVSTRINVLHRHDNLTSDIGGSFEEILSIWLSIDNNGILQFKEDIGLDGSEPARPFKTIYGEENPLKVKRILFNAISVSDWCYSLSRSRRCIPKLDQLLYENEYNTAVWEIENIKSHPAFTPAKIALAVILIGCGIFANTAGGNELKTFGAVFFLVFGGLILAYMSIRWIAAEIVLSRLDRNLQELTLH